MKFGELACAMGKGLMAGAVATAAITASTTIEMKMRDRKASSTPVDAIDKMLGITPKDDEAKERLSNVVHWGYGTSQGMVRGILEQLGFHGRPATLAHFGVVWGASLIMLPALEVSPPVTKWSLEEIGIDALHHMVYAAAAGAAYEALG